jgi:signal transduction histidine kinase
VNLAGLAQEAARDLRLAGGESTRVFLEGPDVMAWADEDSLRQALRNLVMNAADAAGSTGKIVLRTGFEANRRVWIEVEDDGPGVPPQLRDRLFLPFTTGKPGGTGLGLAVVSRVVEEHEGHLECLEGKSGGARFRITLGEVEAAAAGSRAA